MADTENKTEEEEYKEEEQEQTSDEKNKNQPLDKDDEEEEGKEEGEEEGEHDSDEERRLENLKKLGEYVNQMVYRLPSKEIETCCHISRIAQKNPRLLTAAYDDFHDVFSPKERALRIKDEIEQYKAITTEELENELKSYAEKEEKKIKLLKTKNRKRAEILKKCEKACSEKILHKIVERFAAYIADRCENYEPPSVETEHFQKMQQMLMCNLYLNLGDSKKKISPDQNIAKMITIILADLIMQILFLTQNAHKYEEETCEPFLFETGAEVPCQIPEPFVDTSDLARCMSCLDSWK